MKKIMIALIAAACATAVQAASFNWSSSGTNTAKTMYAVDGATTLYASAGAVTLYLFDAATVSQADLLAGLRDGGAIDGFTSVATQTLDANSRLTGKVFDYGVPETDYNFYMAVINGDNVFISDLKAAAGQAADTANVSFTGLKTATQKNMGDATFSTGGWYAVPEPTSGLLMLVGLAGLALRRRRA